jgi:RecJ-like exonuclease
MTTNNVEYSRQLLSDMNSRQAAYNLESKLKSLVTDVCNDCLGAGTLQFCGGEACPECNGTGKPPTEVKVYKCAHCLRTRLEKDDDKFILCSPVSISNPGANHEWFLSTIYTKDNNAPY